MIWNPEFEIWNHIRDKHWNKRSENYITVAITCVEEKLQKKVGLWRHPKVKVGEYTRVIMCKMFLGLILPIKYIQWTLCKMRFTQQQKIFFYKQNGWWQSVFRDWKPNYQFHRKELLKVHSSDMNHFFPRICRLL